MNKPAYIVTDSSITVVVAGKPYTINSSNANFNVVKERIAAQNFKGIERLFDTAGAVGAFTKGNIVVKNGQVYFKGQVIGNIVVDRILQFMREGLPYKPLVAFLENLLQNPSFRAVQELYTFLEKSNLPITDDGYFLAYRKVRDDYKDFYTGTIDNSVGQKPSMPRNLVDEEKSRTCSAGLHFCAYSYLSQYHGGQGRTMMVKINPADVVAIPEDYNNAKGRCCLYEVISEIPNEQEQNFGPLYLTKPEEAFDDSTGEDVEQEDEQDDWGKGYDVGKADANSNIARNPEQAFSNVDDGTINESEFVDGYNDGYDEVLVEQAEEARQNAKPKVTISEATRRKLRRAAKLQKRDANGKFI